MKLYYAKGACSLAVRIVINEVGAVCEFESVDLKTKKTASGVDFLQINPKGAVPALEIKPNEVLTENSVIQQYLAEKYQATQLFPAASDFKHYRVLEWLNYVTTDLHKSFSPLFNAAVPANLKDEVFKPLLLKKLQWVETTLAKNKYLVGDAYTLPDGYLFVILTWFKNLDMSLAEFPHTERYFVELKKRPSIAKALEEEHLT